MSLITSMRRQIAVLWKQGDLDNQGQPSYAAPVEISCRWEDVQEGFLDSGMQKQMSRAVVYVDRDVSPEDVLMLGALDSGVVVDEPFENAGAYAVRAFNKLPNLKNTEYLLTAYL